MTVGPTGSRRHGTLSRRARFAGNAFSGLAQIARVSAAPELPGDWGTDGQRETEPQPKENVMTDDADAIVVGSGINGLVAAAELARAGWSVILLERNAEVGGFIAAEE